MLLGTLAGLLILALAGCYAKSASRQSGKLVRAGFDLEEFGPWVIFTGPGALLAAGGNMALGSLVPLRDGVDPREPEVKWFHSYAGKMRPPAEVAILCHQERATWVTGIRPRAGGSWQSARHEKWHFPFCIETLPGQYEIEVHYFGRQTERANDESVSRQAESTSPSMGVWKAEAGRLYLLKVEFGDPEPAQGAPPQRHIPRTRDIGTTWWGLEESDWYVRIRAAANLSTLEGPVLEYRRAWEKYESQRH